jgi:hypothetical protein
MTFIIMICGFICMIYLGFSKVITNQKHLIRTTTLVVLLVFVILLIIAGQILKMIFTSGM